jgi:hypothetical protein
MPAGLDAAGPRARGGSPWRSGRFSTSAAGRRLTNTPPGTIGSNLKGGKPGAGERRHLTSAAAGGAEDFPTVRIGGRFSLRAGDLAEDRVYTRVWWDNLRFRVPDGEPVRPSPACAPARAWCATRAGLRSCGAGPVRRRASPLAQGLGAAGGGVLDQPADDDIRGAVERLQQAWAQHSAS